jgi:hypothetical protein
MSNPFAALETATATACCAALSNATARLSSGASVSGILRRPYDESLGGYASGAAQTFGGLASQLDGVAVDDTLTVEAVRYRVAEVQPDHAGMIVLTLHRA